MGNPSFVKCNPSHIARKFHFLANGMSLPTSGEFAEILHPRVNKIFSKLKTLPNEFDKVAFRNIENNQKRKLAEYLDRFFC